MALSISTMLAYGSNRPEEIAEAGRTAEEARYTNMFIQACRIPVTIRMEDVTLQQACDEITRQTGIPIRIPTDSVGERVTMDYQDISAGMVLTSMFNLMLMDQAFDPSIVALRVKWWDDCGPQPWRLRSFLRAELLRAPGTLPQQAPSHRPRPCRTPFHATGPGEITERTGIRFAFQAGVGDLPVTIRARNTEAWKIVQAIVDQHRINYDYGDDGTVMIFRPGEGHELFQDGEFARARRRQDAQPSPKPRCVAIRPLLPIRPINRGTPPPIPHSPSSMLGGAEARGAKVYHLRASSVCLYSWPGIRRGGPALSPADVERTSLLVLSVGELARQRVAMEA